MTRFIKSNRVEVLTKFNLKKMNTKTLLVPFVAFLAILVVGFASALVSGTVTTSFNDVVLTTSSNPMIGATGETVPVRVTFTSDISASDVRVKVWMDGYRDEVSASTNRFAVESNTQVSKLLALKLPSDISSVSKDFTLHVSIASSTDLVLASYNVRVERESYSFDIQSVDYDSRISAGDVIPVSVVVENNGYERADDGYVVVTIPELNVFAKGYFGDLIQTDNCTECNDLDSLQKTVYLRIPDNANAGVYDLVVKVYNKDSTKTVTKSVSVEGSASTQALASVKNQDVQVGETVTYDLIVVNSGNKVKVYNIQTVSGTALSVSAPALVSVGPQSSVNVPITVTPTSKAEEGSYTFTVSVDGQQVVYGANVVSGNVSTSVVALTVVLVIIFVVLLIVLIVLLTRKEKTTEETVETSYY